MKRAIKASMVPWSYYDGDKFEQVDSEYLPARGEGETMMNQIVVAVNKIVYRFYNDGDWFDNTTNAVYCSDTCVPFANWLYRYVPEIGDIMYDVKQCYNDDEYSEILKRLADAALIDESIAEKYKDVPKQGSVYSCNGPFKVEEYEEE